MNKIKTILGILISIILLTACEKNAAKMNSKILFQVEYANNAWSIQHDGFMIDSSGNVYSFNTPDPWTYCEINKTISEADMNTNLLSTDSICYTIGRSELLEMLELLNEAKEGNLTEPANVMADMGCTEYSGFLFDESSKTYTKILLKQSGDWQILNKNSSAEKLYQRLFDISLKIRQ